MPKKIPYDFWTKFQDRTYYLIEDFSLVDEAILFLIMRKFNAQLGSTPRILFKTSPSTHGEISTQEAILELDACWMAKEFKFLSFKAERMTILFSEIPPQILAKYSPDDAGKPIEELRRWGAEGFKIQVYKEFELSENLLDTYILLGEDWDDFMIGNNWKVKRT
jgi:hypothetical protein